jgi:hypothetical protein
MKNTEQNQRKTSGFIDRPKTLMGWVGFITTFLGMVGAIMAFGAWVYKVENHEHANTELKAGIAGINARLDRAVEIIDARFRSIEETQTDLRIAIEVAAKLDQIQEAHRTDNTRIINSNPNKAGNRIYRNSPSNNPSSSSSNNRRDLSSTLMDLELKLNQIDEKLVLNYKKEFKF